MKQKFCPGTLFTWHKEGSKPSGYDERPVICLMIGEFIARPPPVVMFMFICNNNIIHECFDWELSYAKIIE